MEPVVLSTVSLTPSIEFWKANPIKSIKTSLGMGVMHCDRTYLVTCCHCIGDFKDINLENNTMKIVNVFKSFEFDLAILEVKTESDVKNKKSFLPLESFCTSVNELSSAAAKASLYICNRVGDSVKKIECAFYEMSFIRYMGYSAPIMPIYKMKIDESKYRDVSELHGISGSYLTDDSKIYGLVSSYNDGSVCVIPSVCIKRLFDEYTNVGTINGICDVYYDVAPCRVNGQNTLLVKRVYRGKKIKIGDIIYSVNNTAVSDGGLVFSKEMGCNIPLNTFVSLYFHNKMSLPIKLYRRTHGNEYDEHSIKIGCIPIVNTLLIPYLQETIFYKYNGLIFTEISEELIKSYENRGIKIAGNLMEIYKTSPYKTFGTKNTKIIGLVDIDYTNLSQREIKTYGSISFPLVGSEQGYMIPILTKVNASNISNINDLKNIIEKMGKVNRASTNTLTFVMSDLLVKRIQYKRDKSFKILK